MKTEDKRFLDFNGQTIYTIEADGQCWIAIKPICDALGVNMKWQKQALKSDPLFSSAIREHTIEVFGMPTGGAGGRNSNPQTPVVQGRKMLCIPERYVYGWIAGLQSNNPDLIAYRLQCYDLLYDRFHSEEEGRSTDLRERAVALHKMRRLRETLKRVPEYQELMALEGVVLAKSRSIKQRDRVSEIAQLDLFKIEQN